MSNVDVYAVVYELNKLLKGSKFVKAYQPRKDIIVLRFHVKNKGRVDVIIQTGVRIHATRYSLENPKFPPSFPMLLRKYLKGGIVESVKQHKFDRIVEFNVKVLGKKNYKLIVELFGKGNIILTEENGKIIQPLRTEKWSDREISAGKKYKYPESRGLNPLKITKSKLKELLLNSDKDVVRTLALNGFGGTYAEEIVYRSGIDKNTPSKSLSDNEINKIYDSIEEIYGSLKEYNFKPQIIVDKDVVPIELKIYKNYEKRYFDNFNKALDEFFTPKLREELKKEKEKVWKNKIEKLERILNSQKNAIKSFKKKAKKYREIGDLIYLKYELISKVINTLKNAKEKYTWKEIIEKVKKAKKENKIKIINSITKDGIVTLNIDGKSVNIDINKSLEKNAEIYYEKAKKIRKKIKGAIKAMEETEKKLNNLKKKRDIEIKNILIPIKKRRKLKWFEKFRWFISSDGFLVIGGRDAQTNEIIVKKYMEENDIYLHADIHGAPSVVIKNKNKKIPENTINEAAIFAASFSKAWTYGLGSADVYWVYPQQVTKSPPSGEYISKGAFVIRGKRNYIRNVPIELAVGIVDYEGPRVMCGPVSSLKKFSKRYVKIIPGYTKKETIARKILKIIDKEKIFRIEDIIRVLPPGKCDLVS
ncbi:Fibronectin-binding A domain protein [Methanothermus fervidus DSM 2088]|uniref:Archaeal Rqc2 homolog aRqcH n=1 Tax=Methanothermus fervidus (strain ATCC 43054 / DSM 2088 / JCM 10308 / V24 S) TaxID=523846 RepID=E3GYX7_METFV|nr:Fibronectin-binding A domain protein [Methanothermus fervidus DSM 2088]